MNGSRCTGAPAAGGRFTTPALAALVALAALAAFSPSLGHGFVWDDKILIPPPGAAPAPSEIFLSPVDRLYRPVRTLSFLLDGALGAGAPAAYHAASVALHAAVSTLLFVFILALASRPRPAFLTALLFAVHPLNAETVSWVSGGRADLLSALFFVLALIFAARFSRAGGTALAAAAACFAAALLSKENAVALPAVALAVAPLMPRAEERRRIFIAAALFTAVLGAYMHLRFNVVGPARQVFTYHGGTPAATLLTTSTVWVSYAREALVPRGLCPVYTVEIHRGFSPQVALSVVLIASAAAAAAAGLIRGRTWGFGLAWFIAALLPVSNIIPIGALKADRFMYLPLIGILIFISFAFDALAARSAAALRRPSAAAPAHAAALAALLVVFLPSLFRLVPVWKDGLALWSHAVECAPSSWIAHNNLGAEYLRRGDGNLALSSFQKAAALNPRSERVYSNLAEVHGRNADYVTALEYLRKSLALNPDNPAALFRAGFALEKL
ncbi:MAG: hypothetical protein AB1742_01490, partial [bacterium]